MTKESTYRLNTIYTLKMIVKLVTPNNKHNAAIIIANVDSVHRLLLIILKETSSKTNHLTLRAKRWLFHIGINQYSLKQIYFKIKFLAREFDRCKCPRQYLCLRKTDR